MNKDRYSNGRNMDSIEMGDRDRGEEHLLGHIAKDGDKPTQEPIKPKEPKAEPMPGMFAGNAEVIYDDEDWQSDEDDDHDDRKLEKEKEAMIPTRKSNILAKVVLLVQMVVRKAFEFLQKVTGGYFWPIVFLLSYIVYFGFAMAYEFGSEASWRLLVCTILGILIASRRYIALCAKKLFRLINGSDQLGPRGSRIWKRFTWGFKWTMNLALLVFIIYVLVDVGIKDIKNLRSLPGLFVLLLVCLLFSSNPAKIDWYVIYWSLGLQFLLAFLALQGETGREAVLWVQERLDEFFANAKAGSKLIFGDSYEEHYMIFAALPLVFLMNATLTLLYYLGAMQLFTRFLGKSLNWIMHTSPVECIAVSGGIFLEGGVMILSLRPFLGSLSKSELFVVITSGLASLGGTYVAILSAFGGLSLSERTTGQTVH